MQRTPLPFAPGKRSFLRYKNGSTAARFAPVDVSRGTKPTGSTWRMNPIPSVVDPGWTSQHNISCNASKTGFPLTRGCRQFEPIACQEGSGAHPWSPIPGYEHAGPEVMGKCSGNLINAAVVDYVVIPKTLEAGEYVVGFRWDCEETAQVTIRFFPQQDSRIFLPITHLHGNTAQVWQQCGDVTVALQKTAAATAAARATTTIIKTEDESVEPLQALSVMREKVRPAEGSVHVASASLVPVEWDKAANWATIERTARTAAAKGARLVLLSEGFLEGYVIMDVNTKNETFDALPTASQQAVLRRFIQIGEPDNGTYIAKARALSKELKIFLQFGFLHRIGGKVYNAVALFDDDGDVVNLYHSECTAARNCFI